MTPTPTLEMIAMAERIADASWSREDYRWDAAHDAALTAIMEVGKWKPMTGAPTNGRRVLVLTERYGAGSAHFDERWHLHFCLNKDARLIGWQELPPPSETGSI